MALFLFVVLIFCSINGCSIAIPAGGGTCRILYQRRRKSRLHRLSFLCVHIVFVGFRGEYLSTL